jgi:hypothetical protein
MRDPNRFQNIGGANPGDIAGQQRLMVLHDPDQAGQVREVAINQLDVGQNAKPAHFLTHDVAGGGAALEMVRGPLVGQPPSITVLVSAIGYSVLLCVVAWLLFARARGCCGWSRAASSMTGRAHDVLERYPGYARIATRDRRGTHGAHRQFRVDRAADPSAHRPPSPHWRPALGSDIYRGVPRSL